MTKLYGGGASNAKKYLHDSKKIGARLILLQKDIVNLENEIVKLKKNYGIKLKHLDNVNNSAFLINKKNSSTLNGTKIGGRFVDEYVILSNKLRDNLKQIENEIEKNQQIIGKIKIQIQKLCEL